LRHCFTHYLVYKGKIMAYSGTGHVTILSLASGKPLSQPATDSSSLTLSEPAIITLQGAPSQVSSYQKQGEDLILRMQDGRVVSYKHFFTAVDGKQSELLFQEEHSLQQALFSEALQSDPQAITSLTPAWHALDDAASLTTASVSAPAAEASDSTTAVGIGLLGLLGAGAGVAAANSGGGGHKSSSTAQTATTENAAASEAAVPVSETTAASTLTAATTDPTAATTTTTATTGDSSISGSSAVVEAPATASTLPELTLDPVTGDNAVNYKEGIYGIELTGTATNLPNDTLVQVTLDGKTWTGSVYNGQWQVQILDDEVAAIKDGSYKITVSATDASGNGTSISQDLLLITHYDSSNPTVTPNDITLANAVQHADGTTWYTLSGTMETPLPLKSFAVQSSETMSWRDGVINADGSWSVEVSADDLRDGFNNLTFGVQDGAGNWFEQSISVNADLSTPVAAGGGSEVTPPVTEDNPTDGDNSDPGTATPGETPTPTGSPSLTINSLTGDGIITADEKQTAQTLSGTTQNLAADSTLTVTLNEKTYTTTLAADGSWSVAIPAADLQVLPVGSNRISVSFDNSAGGTTTLSQAITVEASAPPADAPQPHPTIDTPFVDGIINEQEDSQAYTLTGNTGITGAGQKIALTIDGVSYAGTVDSDGNWSVPLSTDDMYNAAFYQAQGDHTISVTITDVYGQTGTVTSTFAVDTQAPSVTINTLAGDGLIDATEINSPLVISGTGEAGSAVVVTFGTTTLSGTVDENGHWQFSVPAETLQSMDEGSYNVVAKVTDAAGNSDFDSTTVQIFATDALPELTIDPITGDNAVSYQEGIYGILFTGTAAHLPDGTPITLTIDGKTYGGSVGGEGGEWQVQIGDDDVAAIKDGTYKVTVSATDENGNGTSASQDLLLITHYNSSNPTVTVNAVTLANAVQHDDGSTWYTLSGTAETPLPVKSFAIQSSEMMTWHDGVINADGSWSVEVNAEDLREGTSTLTFGVSDGAGNWFEQDINVPVDLTTPVDTSGSSAETPAPVTDDNPTDGDSSTDTSATHDDASAAAAISAAAISADSSTSSTDSSTSSTDSAATSSHVQNIDGETTVVGTESNDTFTLSSLNFLSNLTGGGGHDTLALSGSHEALDFASLGLKASGIETIDLGTLGSNSITLGQKDLLALTDNASDALTIKGADGNAVTLSTTEGGVWSDAGQRTVNGQLFDLYHNSSASHEGTLADVLIQHNLQVQTA